MNKYCSYILGFLALSLALPARAQLLVGPVIDVNFATLSLEPSGSTDPSLRTALGIGATLDYALNPNLSVRTQPMYLQKGAKLDIGIDEDAIFKLSYIELPIMASYRIDLDSDVTPYIMVGPSIGFLLDAKVDVDGFEDDQNDETEGIDFGVGIGGGATIPQGNLTLFVEGRFVAGIVNINAEADEQEVKNRGFQLLFGFTIPINTSN